MVSEGWGENVAAGGQGVAVGRLCSAQGCGVEVAIRFQHFGMADGDGAGLIRGDGEPQIAGEVLAAINSYGAGVLRKGCVQMLHFAHGWRAALGEVLR